MEHDTASRVSDSSDKSTFPLRNALVCGAGHLWIGKAGQEEREQRLLIVVHFRFGTHALI